MYGLCQLPLVTHSKARLQAALPPSAASGDPATLAAPADTHAFIRLSESLRRRWQAEEGSAPELCGMARRNLSPWALAALCICAAMSACAAAGLHPGDPMPVGELWLPPALAAAIRGAAAAPVFRPLQLLVLSRHASPAHPAPLAAPSSTAAVSVETLDGPLTIAPGRSGAPLPLVLVGFDASDPFCVAMWRDPSSLAGLLARAPEGVSVLFFSHSGGCGWALRRCTRW